MSGSDEKKVPDSHDKLFKKLLRWFLPDFLQLFGEDVLTLSYGQVALRDLDSKDYFDANNPLAAALTSLMIIEPEQKGELKLASARAIVDSALTEERKLFLMKVIDQYLPKTAIKIVRTETMEALEEIELHWSDRAIQEGREQGIEIGLVRSVLHLLRRRFAADPSFLKPRLEQLSAEALELLLDDVLTAADLSAFEERLAAIEAEMD